MGRRLVEVCWARGLVGSRVCTKSRCPSRRPFKRGTCARRHASHTATRGRRHCGHGQLQADTQPSSPPARSTGPCWPRGCSHATAQTAPEWHQPCLASWARTTAPPLPSSGLQAEASPASEPVAHSGPPCQVTAPATTQRAWTRTGTPGGSAGMRPEGPAPAPGRRTRHRSSPTGEATSLPPSPGSAARKATGDRVVSPLRRSVVLPAQTDGGHGGWTCPRSKAAAASADHLDNRPRRTTSAAGAPLPRSAAATTASSALHASATRAIEAARPAPGNEASAPAMALPASAVVGQGRTSSAAESRHVRIRRSDTVTGTAGAPASTLLAACVPAGCSAAAAASPSDPAASRCAISTPAHAFPVASAQNAARAPGSQLADTTGEAAGDTTMV